MFTNLGSGCSSAGRTAASDTRGLQLKSNHRQMFSHLFIVNYGIEKIKTKKRGR